MPASVYLRTISARESVSLGNCLPAACWIRIHSLEVRFSDTQNMLTALHVARATGNGFSPKPYRLGSAATAADYKRNGDFT
jgi:hypothetical protein